MIFLPEVVHFSPNLYVYPLMLFGFVTFFLSERYLYQHIKDEILLEKEIYHLHALGFFIDHFIKGFILVTIIELEPVLGLLTAIPFFIHTLSSTIALERIHRTSGNKIDKFLLSSSLLIGTLTAIFIEISVHMERGILAFVIGLLFFMVSRDVLPKKREGKPGYFFIGMMIVLIIWLLMQFNIT